MHHSEPSQTANDVSRHVVDAALAVHKELGPGLLESAYEKCLAHELDLRYLQAEQQVEVPLLYKGKQIPTALRVDLMVQRQVVVEIKAIDQIFPVHEAQLLTYLRFTGLTIGLLINFNVPRLKDGLRRLILTERDRRE